MAEETSEYDACDGEEKAAALDDVEKSLKLQGNGGIDFVLRAAVVLLVVCPTSTLQLIMWCRSLGRSDLTPIRTEWPTWYGMEIVKLWTVNKSFWAQTFRLSKKERVMRRERARVFRYFISRQSRQRSIGRIRNFIVHSLVKEKKRETKILQQSLQRQYLDVG